MLFAVHANLAGACNTAGLVQCQAAWNAGVQAAAITTPSSGVVPTSGVAPSGVNLAASTPGGVVPTGVNVCAALETYRMCVTNAVTAAACPAPVITPFTAAVTQAETQHRAVCIALKCRGGDMKNKFHLTLWEMFLGPWGADRFYLGNVGTGVLKLITCGGCMIWAIIDMIGVYVNAMKELPDIEYVGMQACFEVDTLSSAKTVATFNIIIFVASCALTCIMACITGAAGRGAAKKGFQQSDDEDESE